jgi:hypothetical protein
MLQAIEQCDDFGFARLVEVAGRSSARSRRGALISARAMAARRCSPPDSMAGK